MRDAIERSQTLLKLCSRRHPVERSRVPHHDSNKNRPPFRGRRAVGAVHHVEGRSDADACRRLHSAGSAESIEPSEMPRLCRRSKTALV